MIPDPTSGWDGVRRRSDEGWRRWAEVATEAALQGQGGGAQGLGGFVEERRREEGPIYRTGEEEERGPQRWCRTASSAELVNGGGASGGAERRWAVARSV